MSGRATSHRGVLFVGIEVLANRLIQAEALVIRLGALVLLELRRIVVEKLLALRNGRLVRCGRRLRDRLALPLHLLLSSFYLLLDGQSPRSRPHHNPAARLL